MNHFLNGVVRAVAETFELPTPILEIGSYQAQGNQDYCNLRALFAGKNYIGLDMRTGPGVDCVGDVEALPQADGSVGTVLAMSTFEHVKRFWRGFDEVHRVLRPDGALLISVPFYFHIHNYPSDYWRFTPEALELLLEKYPQKIIGWNGPKKRPAQVWALAFREERAPITPAEYQRYRDLMGKHARQPMRSRRLLRYSLGRLLFGRGPFAPYLDREQWESECRIAGSPR